MTKKADLNGLEFEGENVTVRELARRIALPIVQKISGKTQIEEAVDQVSKKLWGHEGFDRWLRGHGIEVLVNLVVRDVVHDLRHEMNRRAKGRNGRDIDAKRLKPRVKASDSITLAVASSHRYEDNLMELRISGQRLGDLLGSELEGLAAAEDRLAKGHIRNARLLRRIRPLVPDNARVRDKLTEKQLRSFWKEIETEVVTTVINGRKPKRTRKPRAVATV